MRATASSGSPFEPTIGFSRAVRVDRHVYVAGTCAVWPDGHVDEDAGVQAERCLEIIRDALEQVGATIADVVRTRMYLIDAEDVDAVSAVHGRWFADVRPAASMLFVKGFLDPRWRVEIEAQALIA